MIIINVLTSPIANSILNLGRQGENRAREIWFDLSWLIDTYGEGTATVLHKRKSDDAPYLVTLEQEGKTAAWKINNLDTAYDGFGQCELRWTVGDTLAKTITYRTIVQKSMTEDTVMPDPYESWYDQMIEYIDGITDRIENSDAVVETLEPSQDATADVQFSAEGLHFAFGIPRGQDGLPGADGQDGYTPQKGIDYFDGAPGKDGKDGADGYTPIKGVDYTDGKDGKDGAPGKDGADGHTPVITAQKSGSTTVVYVDGTAVATISDGTNGADGQDGHTPTITASKSGTVTTLYVDGAAVATIYDGAVDSVNGKTGVVVLDAEDVGALPDSTAIPSKTSDLQNDSGFGTYSKPSGGIPKNDLASAVQNSLGKADTALQSYTETDPTVPAWAKASTKPAYTAQEVGALPVSTVIPSKTSDLTNDSGFLTSAPVASVNGRTGAVTGLIDAPSSPVTGAFLVWNGSAWVAQTLSTWQGGNY